MKKYIGSVVTMVFLLIPVLAWGQMGVGFDGGVNTGVHGDLTGPVWIKDSKVGPTFSLTIFASHFAEKDRRSRLGFRFGTQNVKAIPDEGEDYATNYRSRTFQLEYEILLTKGARAQLATGWGMGFVSRTDRNEHRDYNQCHSAFCNFPEFNWLLSPKIRGMVNLSGSFALTGELRGNFYSNGPSETFPYKSGMMMLVGIEYRGFPEEKEKRDLNEGDVEFLY